MKGWRSMVVIALLGCTGALMTTPFPSQAYVFVRTLEKSSRNPGKVTIWERVVYSLIEASNRGAERAPIS